MPAWSVDVAGIGGVVNAFMAGFGIAFTAGLTVFVAVSGVWMLRKVLAAAGI